MTTVSGPVFFAGHCLRTRKGTCKKCAAACPQQALRMEPGGPVRDETRCTRCGVCATVCPASVFAPHADNRHLPRYLANCPRNTRLVLACTAVSPDRLPDDARDGACNAVKLTGCPGALLDAAIATCAATGVRTVDCLHGDCSACSSGNTLAVERVKELWESLFGPFSLRAAPAVAKGNRKIPDVRTLPMTRRSFFRFPVTTLFPSSRLGPELWDGTTPPRLRRIFRDIVRESPESLRSGATLPERLHAPFLTVDATRCTACGACARACPTGALELNEPGGTLAFAPGLCVGCGLCGSVCRAEAVTWTAAENGDPARFFGNPEIFGLQGIAPCACARCRALFTPRNQDDEYCGICTKRLGIGV